MQMSIGGELTEVCASARVRPLLSGRPVHQESARGPWKLVSLHLAYSFIPQ